MVTNSKIPKCMVIIYIIIMNLKKPQNAWSCKLTHSLSPLRKERISGLTWILNSLYPSLVETGPAGLGKKILYLYFCYFFIISPWKRGWLFIWTNLNSMLLGWGFFGPSFVEIGTVDVTLKSLQTDEQTDAFSSGELKWMYGCACKHTILWLATRSSQALMVTQVSETLHWLLVRMAHVRA